MENQSAIQSILDTPTAFEGHPTQEDDDDVFTCGKCKKQFKSLEQFVSHKQYPCMSLSARSNSTLLNNTLLQSLGNSAFTATQARSSVMSQIAQQNGFTSVSQSGHGQTGFAAVTQPGLSQTGFTTVTQPGLTQLTHNMMITDDQLLAFSDLGQTIHLTHGNTLQTNGPYLSQVAHLTPRSSTNLTILGVPPSSLSQSNGSAFTRSGSAENLQQMVHTPHQITIATGIGDKPHNIHHIIKPSPTKAGVLNSQGDQSGCHPSSLLDDGKKKLVCNFCCKVFTKNFDLQQHIRSHTGEKPFQCVVCGRAFAQKSNVKKHMSTHKVWPSGQGTTLPAQPPPMLVRDSNDQTPAAVMDSSNTIVCLQENTEQIEIAEQPSLSTDEKNDKKQIKQESFKLKVVIDKSYMCQYCPEKFKTYYQLKSHMVRHKSVQVYKCVVRNCFGTFKDLDEFLDHTNTHNDEMTYRCHQCNKTFISLYELAVHQYSHGLYPGNKSGPRHFQCNKCLNKYATPEALEHHMSTTNHSIPCPHCQKIFTCERFLRKHLASHGTENLFECQVCNKSFKTEHYLKNHALIHTGEKPFECEECGATFNRKDKLKRHNLIHDKRVRYKCPFKFVSGCEKEFNRPDKLKAHLLSHSCVKQFSCQICGKQFARKAHLKEHERAHRSDYSYKCEKCSKGFFRPKPFKEHKCVDEDGNIIKRRVFAPRRLRRKPGRPKKTLKPKERDIEPLPVKVVNPGNKNENIVVIKTMMRTRSKSQKSKDEENYLKDTGGDEVEGGMQSVEINQIKQAETIASESSANEHDHNSASIIESSNKLTDVMETKTLKKKPECYVKVQSANMVPVSMVERYVTVHLTTTSNGNGNEIQAQLIPATDLNGHLQFSTHLQTGQLELSPTSTTFHNFQIIEGQPVTLTVSHCDQLGKLGVNGASVVDIPVDIVTVSNEQAIVCAQQVTNSGDSSEQTYTAMESYDVGDVVLHDTENLMNTSVEIMDSVNVDIS